MSHKLFIYIHVLYRCLVSKEALKDFQDISLEMEMYLRKCSSCNAQISANQKSNVSFISCSE